MDRNILTDAQWVKIEPHCLGKRTDPGRSGGDSRRFMEAVLWVARAGSSWRELPAHYGNWSTAFRRFCEWRKPFFENIMPHAASTISPVAGLEALADGFDKLGVIGCLCCPLFNASLTAVSFSDVRLSVPPASFQSQAIDFPAV